MANRVSALQAALKLHQATGKLVARLQQDGLNGLEQRTRLAALLGAVTEAYPPLLDAFAKWQCEEMQKAVLQHDD